MVQVLTFAPGRTRFRATAEAGSHDTARFSGFGGSQRGPWNFDAAGEWLRTDGVVIVGEEVRGPVDVRADSDYATGFLGGGYNAGSWHAGLRLSLYDEERASGSRSSRRFRPRLRPRRVSGRGRRRRRSGCSAPNSSGRGGASRKRGTRLRACRAGRSRRAASRRTARCSRAPASPRSTV